MAWHTRSGCCTLNALDAGLLCSRLPAEGLRAYHLLCALRISRWQLDWIFDVDSLRVLGIVRIASHSQQVTPMDILRVSDLEALDRGLVLRSTLTPRGRARVLRLLTRAWTEQALENL